MTDTNTTKAQLNEAVWNLEVSHQSEKERLQELEESEAKIKTVIKNLEKSKSDLVLKMEMVKSQEAHLLRQNEMLQAKLEMERQKFIKMLDEERWKLEALYQQPLVVHKVCDVEKEAKQAMEEIYVAPIELKETPPSPTKKTVQYYTAFNQSLSDSLVQSQKQVENLFSQLQILERENDELRQSVVEYKKAIQQLQGKIKVPRKGISFGSQTEGSTQSLKVSDNVNLLLVNRDTESWSLTRHQAFQAPSILTSSHDFVEVLIKKNKVYTSENKETYVEEQDLALKESELPPLPDTEPSEIGVQYSPAMMDNGGQMIEALTYTMIGTWVFCLFYKFLSVLSAYSNPGSFSNSIVKIKTLD